MARVAVVTGANKGIGFEVVKQLCQQNPNWIVYLTARDVGRGQAAFEQLKSSGLNLRFHQLDVASLESIQHFASFLKNEHGYLDVLVNNAAVLLSSSQTALTIQINYTGLISVCKELFPLLRDHARVVNVSSRDGHFTLRSLSPALQDAFKKCQTIDDVDKLMADYVQQVEKRTAHQAGWDSYCYGVSKIGVTVASYIQQRMLDEDTSRNDLTVNVCCPGLVRTDMSSNSGDKSAAQGADTLVYLATLPENCQQPRGRFVNERVINCIFKDGRGYY